MRLPSTPIVILTTPAPTFRERLAGAELWRGLRQLGASSMIISDLPGPDPVDGGLRFVLRAGRASGEGYSISADSGPHTTVTVSGSSDRGLLWGVFDFLERQGAVFGLDGDLYPLEMPKALTLPGAGESWRGSPRFTVRGLLPWPDFLNGITTHNREDFRAYLEAMLRMRLNMLGIHVYAQQKKWVEPFLGFEYAGVGYTAYGDTTATDRWGYLPQRTSRFGMGAADLYDDEVFGADAARQARSPWEALEQARALWRDAFAYAEALGIRTGVGFEPYQLPDEIVRAAPPQVRFAHTVDLGHERLTINRLDPESRAARRVLEARLGSLLESYPSVDYIYLWEEELMHWASKGRDMPLPVTPFQQAHDFLRRHAPGKRLVLAGWGGAARHFAAFHRALPEDIIFTCLSDSLGWEPVSAAFAGLDNRERWIAPWLEDDEGMWLPQLHSARLARDLGLAEQYGAQGVMSVHWRHRILDATAAFLARRTWDGSAQPADRYTAYARTQATGKRAASLGRLLAEADSERRLLSTWNGDRHPDGTPRTEDLSGDFGEAFLIERDYNLSEARLRPHNETLAALADLLDKAAHPLERERLAYWHGQVGWAAHYARAWREGRALHLALDKAFARRKAGDETGAVEQVRAALPRWLELLRHVRAAVLDYQRSAATRSDLGTLASIQNKFVRIAALRFRETLLEFIDPLPAKAESALAAALAPDSDRQAALIVPTRPTRLTPGESVTITAIAPGARPITAVTLCWRESGRAAWNDITMQHAGRRTWRAALTMPQGISGGIEWRVVALFGGAPDALTVEAPPAGAAPYLMSQ